jgi:organic radical activating enzyme
MNDLKTKITWNLSNYCKSECSYCPTSLRGGDVPNDIEEYKRVAQLIIDNYTKMGRTIEWTINGGEPLDIDYFPSFLKLCRENGDRLSLHTNGGKIWMDWWAIEPYVDYLSLSYHYWQQPSLVKYIIQTFQKNNKGLDVIVPIRPDHFDEDIKRAIDIENEFSIVVSKSILYNNADTVGGMFPYTEQQLRIIRGEELVAEQQYFESTTHDERYQDTYNSNPSFTGQMCNAGIERLNIGHLGWVSGSDCNNIPLGNIWIPGWTPPTQGQKCGKISCISGSDQQITKFSQ